MSARLGEDKSAAAPRPQSVTELFSTGVLALGGEELGDATVQDITGVVRLARDAPS